MVADGRVAEGRKVLEEMRAAFGDRFYVELPRQGLPSEVTRSVLATTDVLVCGVLTPVTGFGSTYGFEHCAYSAKTGSSWSSFPLYWNEHQPLVLDKADYVFQAYIKDGSVTEGDVESPLITLYEPQG